MEKFEGEDQRTIEVGSDQGVNEDGSRVGSEGGAEAVVVTKVKPGGPGDGIDVGLQ